MVPMHVEPVILEGRTVRLEPLTLEHVPALCDVGLEPGLWRWIPNPVTNAAEMREYVEIALDERRRGVAMPFATVHQPTARVVGSTRYNNIDPVNRRLEI